MQRRTFLLISTFVAIIVVFAAVGVVGCAKPAPAPSPAPAPAPAPAPKAEPIVLKALTMVPASNERAVAFRQWLDLVNERAKGELRFDYIGGPEVIAYREQPQAIRKGVIDISYVGASVFKGLVPEARMMALSLLSQEEERKVGATDLMRKYFAKGGFYFVGRADPKLDPKNFTLFFNKKIATLDDMKGLKCGATGTYVDAMVKALGMSMSIIKPADAYSALDRGMLDAFAWNIATAGSYTLQEVAPYTLDHSVYRSNTNLPMNLDKWNKLPEHLKKLIGDVYVEFEPTMIKLMAEALVDAKKTFQEAGVEFFSLSPEDFERFISIAYEAEAQKYLKEMPDIAPEYLKLVKAIK